MKFTRRLAEAADRLRGENSARADGADVLAARAETVPSTSAPAAALPSVTFLVFNLDGMGGTSRSAITQANALVRLGHPVSFLSVTRSADTPHYPIDPRVSVDYLVDVGDGTPTARSRLIPQRWDGQFFRAADRPLRDALRAVDTDVLVTLTPALLALGAQFAPDRVTVVHQEHRSSADRTNGLEPLLTFAPRVDAVALLTEASADWLAAELGGTAPRLLVIPNPLPDKPPPRSPLTDPVIIAAGRLVPEKQFAQVLRAFAEIAPDRPEWRLRILGDGPRMPELQALKTKLEAADPTLAGRIDLPGAVADLAPELAKVSVCVLSSRTEGFPLVAQEAMSAGVPVVSYDCPSGPRELIEDARSGLLVAPGSVTALASALQRITGDQELLRQLGEGAFQASQRYDTVTIAQRWSELFSELVAAHGQPGKPAKPAGRPRHTRRRSPSDEPLLITPQAARSAALSYAAQAARGLDSADLTSAWFVIPPRRGQGARVIVDAAARGSFLQALDTDQHWALRDPGDGGWPERRLPVADLVQWQRRARSPRLILEPWPQDAAGRRTHLADDSGVTIEFWERPAGASVWVAPTPGPGPERLAGPDCVREILGITVPSIQALVTPSVSEVAYPIDVVYTWVDDADPAWQASRAARRGDGEPREAAGAARFRNRDELRFSMRSVHLFAPWVRTIYLVTAGQRPAWLAEHPQVRVIDHREILPGEALPTFNSQAIETALHRIPGLSEQFLYVNDDVFLGRPTTPELFFSPGGATSAFLSPNFVADQDPAGVAPYLQAALNNRALLFEEFGVRTEHTLIHSPHAHRVSVLRAIEERFGEAVDRTAQAPFRSASDLSLLSSFAQHFGLITGTAFAASAEHLFLDLAGAGIEQQLKRLRARDLDFFCVGDHHDFALDEETVETMLADTLADLYPVAAPWEQEQGQGA